MNLLLTTYQLSAWSTLFGNIELEKFDSPPESDIQESAIVKSAVTSEIVTRLLLSKQNANQKIWLGFSQAEYYLAAALENGQPLPAAAAEWQSLASETLNFHIQNRRKISLFNIHQALFAPIRFAELLFNKTTNDNVTCDIKAECFQLIIANQYVNQNPELKQLNRLLQASAVSLCISETITFDFEKITQHITNIASRESSFLSLKNQLQDKENTLSQLAIEINQLQFSNKKSATELKDVINSETELISSLHKTQHHLEILLIENQALKDTIKTNESDSNLSIEASTRLIRDLKSDVDRLKQEQSTLKMNRDKLSAELDSARLDQKKYQVELEKERQESKHAILARDKQYKRDIKKLEDKLRKSSAKAAGAEFNEQVSEEKLNLFKKSISWKLGKPIRAIGGLLRNKDETRDQLVRNIGLILTSEYFDVEWYLRTYTDVAQNGINPAEHYLLFGAAEGRLPGPLFDGNWYLTQYPDFANANINPLLHFILYGQQEGRRSSPKMLTNSSPDAED